MKNIIGVIVLLAAVLGCSSLSKKETADNTAAAPAKSEPAKTSDSSTTSEPAKSAPSASDLSLDKFDQLKIGTKYDEAVKILGGDGSESSSSSSGSNKYATYKWEGSDNARITGSFKNDELTMKSHFNVRGSGGTPPKADISKSKYEEIQTGMTLPEVVKIIGSDGLQTSSSVSQNFKTVSYKWEGDKYVRINLSFKDDKVSSKSQSNLK